MPKKGYKQTKEQKEKTRQLVKKQWETGKRKGGYKIKDTSKMKKAQKKRLEDSEIRKKRGQQLLKRDTKKWKNSLSISKKEFYQSKEGKKWIEKYSPIISKKTKENYQDPIFYNKFVDAMRNSKVWQDGKSFEKYGLDFNRKLRTEVRKTDNNTCQLCLRNLDLIDENAAVHHIDYDKKNNKKTNLISLCKSCHSKTNFNRERWTTYFKQLKKIKEKKYKNKEVLIITTRPCTLKMYPIWKKLKNEAVVINMGQQKELIEQTLKMLDWTPDFDLNIMKKSQTLNIIMTEIMSLLPSVLESIKPKRVWVHGDTSSSLAVALVSSMLKIPLVHNEAGLRTYDKRNPFPEEINRQLIDRMADIYFAPTKQAAKNLKKEGIRKNVYVVGNTVIDALEMIKKTLPDKRPIEEKYVLATVHRRESFGDEIEQIFLALKELSKKIKIIIPAHPNPNVQKIIKKVKIDTVEPMNYKDFLWHMKHCEYIVSDSGGVQEEAPSFKKKVIVLRKTTERGELIKLGYGILVKKLEKDYILKSIDKFLTKKVIFGKNPFGDGKSSMRILRIINKLSKNLK